MALARLGNVAPSGRQTSDLPALAAVGWEWAIRAGYPDLSPDAAVALGMIQNLTGRADHLHQTVWDQAPRVAREWAHRFARELGYSLDDAQANELHRLRAHVSGDKKSLGAYVKKEGRRLGAEPESPLSLEHIPAPQVAERAVATEESEKMTEATLVKWTPSELERARETAAQLGKPLAWLIRRAVRSDVEDAQAERDDFPRRS
jgi:hypothetical protein